jgi:hypothetical protein
VEYVEFFDIDGTPDRVEFRTRFRDRFGGRPRSTEILAYDATTVLLEGIRTGPRTGEELRRYLFSLGLDGPRIEALSGPVRFDRDRSVRRSYVFVSLGRPQRAP